ILNDIAIRCDEKDLQSDINARLTTLEREWLRGYFSAGEADVPAIGFSSDRDRLGRAFQWARPAHGNTPNLGQDQKSIVQPRTIAKLLVGETSITLSALEPRIAWLFTCRHPSKEGVVGVVQPGEHILQHLTVDSAVLRADFLDGWELGALDRQRNTDATLLPRRLSLLQASIVEFAATAQYKLHDLLLVWSRLEFVLVGFAHSCCVHMILFCLIADNTAIQWALHPLAKAEGLSGPFM